MADSMEKMTGETGSITQAYESAQEAKKELERKRASVKPGATPTPQNVISSF